MKGRGRAAASRYVGVWGIRLTVALHAVFLLLLVYVWRLAARTGGGYLVPLLFSAAFLTSVVLTYSFFVQPYRLAERMLRVFSGGYTMEGFETLRWRLSPGTEELAKKITEMLTSEDTLNLSKRQAQFLAMQNQINPHFLYNTLEGIRGEALLSGNEGIAMMTESLAEFFRYTISGMENLVTLREELANVQNYYTIQQYRFGDRLSLGIVFDSEGDREFLMNAKVPKLILQPIVENAIIHGIEGLPADGLVTVRIICTGKRLLITVSDNGAGISPDKLGELNAVISDLYERYAHGSGRRGGIALANVNNRIKLLFGADYGVNILSVPGRGTDVELTLPYVTRHSLAEDSQMGVLGMRQG